MVKSVVETLLLRSDSTDRDLWGHEINHYKYRFRITIGRRWQQTMKYNQTTASKYTQGKTNTIVANAKYENL